MCLVLIAVVLAAVPAAARPGFRVMQLPHLSIDLDTPVEARGNGAGATLDGVVPTASSEGSWSNKVFAPSFSIGPFHAQIGRAISDNDVVQAHFASDALPAVGFMASGMSGNLRSGRLLFVWPINH
jgi:hypothetical protein